MPHERARRSVPADRLSKFGRVRAAGFPLLATFDHPHFTLVLADLTELTIARMSRCFDDPILGPRPSTARVVWTDTKEVPSVTAYDLTVDFMDMTNNRRLWTRIDDARPGLRPAVGAYLVVGCEDADPAVARVRVIDEDGNIELEVLRGSVESHHDLLALA